MVLYINRPVLYEKATEQALNAMRSGSHLDAAHPLQLFLNVQFALNTPYALRGDTAVQLALFQHLKTVINERVGALRQQHHLPFPDDRCTDVDLIADFRQNNTELEAWSVLYYRYVCVDRDLSMQQLADLARQDARTLRRRHQLGITRLTSELVAREQQTRRHEITRRLRLALPVAQPPTLNGVETLLATALHILIGSDPPRHLVLHGASGIDKTTLAQLLAHTLVGTHQIDDLLWFDVPASVPTQTSLVHSFIERLGLCLTADEDPVWTLRAYLLSHPTLIILDGAEALLDAPERASSLLTLLDSASVVLTSTVLPPLSLWCSSITLPGLNREQALAWLDRVLSQNPEREPAWIRRFERVWQIVGGNPRLLRTMLELSETLPLDSALAQVDPLYEDAWRQLSSAGQQVCLLGLLFARKGVSYGQLQKLSRLANELDPIILALSRQGLWMVDNEQETYYYQPSPLFAAFLSRYIASNPVITGEETLPVRLNRLLRRAVDVLVQSPDPETGLDLVRLTNQWHIHEIESWEYVYRLAPQITQAGLWLDWYEQLSVLLEYEHDPSRTCWLHQMAGTALRWLGQLGEARDHLEQALAGDRHAGHPRQANVMSELAVVLRYQGRWQEAYEQLQAALAIYTGFEESQGVERCLHELAQLCLENGDAERSLDWLSRLDTWFLRSWGIAGQAYISLGQLERAREAASQLEALLPVSPSPQGRTTASLGVIYDALGDTDAAVAFFRLAVGLLERSKDMLGYARTCNNLAVAYLKQPSERREEALEAIRQRLLAAQQIQEHTGDEVGLAITRQNLTWLESESGPMPEPDG